MTTVNSPITWPARLVGKRILLKALSVILAAELSSCINSTEDSHGISYCNIHCQFD